VARVRLVVTGIGEQEGLPASLEDHFPTDHRGEAVEFEAVYEHSGTSATVDPYQGQDERWMSGVARRIAAEALDRDRRGSPDLVVFLDDLEVDNFHQPEQVVAWLRYQLNREIQEAADGPALRERLRSACSFHFMKPMLEAYFFGAPGTLQRLGDGVALPALLHSPDVEDFLAVDSTPTWTSEVASKNAQRHSRGLTWWDHRRHAKDYLFHLRHRLTGHLYRETQEGRNALETMRWRAVAERPEHVPFIRSFFADIADALGVLNPLDVHEPGLRAGLTYLGPGFKGPRILRNIADPRQ
jgi:hypothetical protein